MRRGVPRRRLQHDFLLRHAPERHLHELHHAGVSDARILAERPRAQTFGPAHRIRRLGAEFLLHQADQVRMAMHAESKQGTHLIAIIGQVLHHLRRARLLQLGADSGNGHSMPNA
jgi:hypothetical protein